MPQRDYQIYSLGDVVLQSGEVLDSATLAFKTYGTLNARADNAVLMPTFYTGNHKRNEGFFGTGRALDPSRHYIISVNMFGNGLSTSPSNASASQRGAAFPKVTLFDNVACQYALVSSHLGVRQLALVTGWSMAGCQAYQWAAQYPDYVQAIVPFCASAKTSPHNFVFLEGVKAALTADQDWDSGNYVSPPVRGLKAFGRVYAGWAYSQAFFRDAHFKSLGYATIEDLLIDWENDHARNWDANNLLAKLHTWQAADISANSTYKSNFREALRSIRARAIVIPCTQDLYFPPEDNALEVRDISGAELRPYGSPFGHCVANPGNDKGFERFLDAAIAEVLA